MSLRGRVAQKLAGDSGDRVFNTILRGGLTSIGVRSAGLVLGLSSHVLLSRSLGAGNYGLYAIALGWCMILVVPAVFGLDHTVLRYASVYLEEQRAGFLKSLLFFSLRVLFLSTVLVGVGVFSVAWLKPQALGIATTQDAIWIVLLIGVLACLGVFSAFFRAAHRIFSAQFYEQVLRPTILIAALYAVLASGQHLTLGTALMVTALSALCALVALLFRFRVVFAKQFGARTEKGEPKAWLSLSWPVFMIAVAQQIMAQSTVILLGWLSTSETAGYYAAAARLAGLVSFALVAINSISAPMIAASYKRGDMGDLRRIAYITARLALFSAICASLVFFAAGRQILSAFGDGFEQAYPALLILLMGGLVNAGTGSVGIFMVMTNRQKSALMIILLALTINLSLSLMLIPLYGLIGGALAAAAGIAVMNIGLYIYVRRSLGIDTSVLGLGNKHRLEPS